jgi:stage IV sporulation protein FB
VAGTEVRVHVTFFILLAAVAWVYFEQGGAGAAIEGVLFILAVFGCVLLHEFGHVTMARRFGVRTPDVTLLPIGGLARLERMPENPRQELLVALAGPAVNVVIAGVLAVFYGVAALVRPRGLEAMLFDPSFGERLMIINVILVVFNMIPAFPMDGGRVLRALLAMTMPYGRATELAATIGQVLAVAGGLLGLSAMNPILVLIAVFIFMAARGESAMVQAKIAREGVPLDRARMTDFHVLREGDTLHDAAAALLAGSQHDFPVLDRDGRLDGMLTRAGLIEGITKRGPTARVDEAMLRDVPSVPLHYPLREAFQVLRASPLESLPVVAENGGRVLGLLTAENVGELILLRNALASGGA